MVRIRLSRGGTKKRPFYRIVAADKRNARDGRRIEPLGYFNPIATGKDTRLNIDIERYQYWLSHGAQPSERVMSLVKQYEQTNTRANTTTTKPEAEQSAQSE